MDRRAEMSRRETWAIGDDAFGQPVLLNDVRL
jgi:hypothetical protein